MWYEKSYGETESSVARIGVKGINYLTEQGGNILRKCQNFANNLELIRNIRKTTLYEFSQELGIPKSTLQSLLREGNTTLDTAIRIADNLNLSVDALLRNDLEPEKCDMLMALLESLTWFTNKSPEQRHRLKACIEELLTEMCEYNEYIEGENEVL